MNRKHALLTLAGGGLLLGAPGVLANSAQGSTDALRDFRHRWQVTKDYSLKVLDKMPEDRYGYVPTPDQMSFGKLFTHTAHWNTFFMGMILNKVPLPEPTDLARTTVRGYFASCHDHCTGIIEQLSDHQLDQTGYGEHGYWKQHSGRDLLLRAFMHTAHHRAQALVYLRLNGLEPPFFEF